MEEITVKVPAKINLTLDITGVKDGYHLLSSLVSTVSVYDIITVKKRSDKNVTLTEKGIVTGVSADKNNAVKSAIKFMRETGVNGVDITVDKHIPLGSGMGGSSADIAGVIYAMNKLYGVGDVVGLANALGSDSGYMTVGGYAVLKGRGDIFEKQDIDLKAYYLFITNPKTILASESYRWYDEQGKAFENCTDKAVNYLKENRLTDFCSVIKNDLYYATEDKRSDVKLAIEKLKTAGANASLMTGSGSAVYGLFFDKTARDNAYKTLKAEYKDALLIAETSGGITVE